MSENKLRALIVDDDPDTLFVVAYFVRTLGYETTTADCAAAALEIARAESFDLVLSDIGMPLMNGYELAVALRKLPAYKSVVMIAITGFSFYDDRRRALEAGFNFHMVKPIDPPTLAATIKRLQGQIK